jgi:hypothetical protein
MEADSREQQRHIEATPHHTAQRSTAQHGTAAARAQQPDCRLTTGQIRRCEGITSQNSRVTPEQPTGAGGAAHNVASEGQGALSHALGHTTDGASGL